MIRHIRDEIVFIREAVGEKDKDAVTNDPVLYRAIIRSLEIIGEASNKLDPHFKVEHSEIEWRRIVTTRNKLIHHYFGVDYEIVWDIIKHKLPNLLDFVEQIIAEG